MKTLLALCFCLVLSLNTYSQIQSDTTTYVYCQIAAVSKYGTVAGNPFNMNLFYDFGDGKTFGPDNPLKDEKGNSLNYESSVDAITYLSKLGWTLQTSTSIYLSNWGGRWVDRIFLKKRKYDIK